MNELIHKNCWKLMSLLVDVEEWRQIVIGNMLSLGMPGHRLLILTLE